MSHWLATVDVGDILLGVLALCVAGGGICWLLASLWADRPGKRAPAPSRNNGLSDEQVEAVVTSTVIASSITTLNH